MPTSRATRFTVIIPTRNRHSTLGHSLQTVLSQSYQDFEIVVCDNCSSEETRQVVDQLGSTKVKYVRSDTPLAMTDNWELALSHAEGEYIVVLGDDDGLLRNALQDADALLRELQSPLLRVQLVGYNWPGLPLAGLSSTLWIRVQEADGWHDGLQVIDAVANRGGDYRSLPMVYNSFVRRDLLDGLRRRCGRVFFSLAPDIYTGFALAFVTRRFPSTGRPMVIRGVSPKSNGVACCALNGRSEIAEEFYSLNQGANNSFAISVPAVSCLSATIADSFEVAKEKLFPGREGPCLDRRALVRRCLKEFRPSTEADRQHIFEEFRRVLQGDSRGVAWLEKAWRDQRRDETNHPRTYQRGFVGDRSLTLNASDFGVEDVDGAAVLCDKILGLSSRPASWSEPRRLKDFARDVTPPFLWRLLQRAKRSAGQLTSQRT